MIGLGLARGGRTDRGFAILLVLWLLVLLSAIALHLTATGRSELRVAFNVTAAASAEALADAGIAQTVFALTDPNPDGRWSMDGRVHEVALGDGRINVTIRNENGKINPNIAPEQLVAALFHQIGVEQERAAAMAAAITARVRPGIFAPLPSSGSNSADGTTARASQPMPFDSVDELASLPGMTPEILGAAAPYLSVDSTVSVPPADAAAAIVLSAEAEFQTRTGVDVIGSRDAPGARPRNPTVAIRAVARTASGAQFIREAVVRVDPSIARGYLVLRWRRGEQADASSIATAQGL
jgi:general secretion pathway protein K